MGARARGLSILEVNVALLLVALTILAMYAAMTTSMKLSQKDAVLTEASWLAQEVLEQQVLTAKTTAGFQNLTSQSATYVGDYNGDAQYFVEEIVVTPLQNLATVPTPTIKRITVRISLAQAGAVVPTPARLLLQLSAVATSS